MKITNKSKPIITIILSSIVIVLALMGASWKTGFADTNPTIPIFYYVTPPYFCAGSDDVDVVITGDNFINYFGDYYTHISWLGPGESVPTIIIPDYINEAGTELRFHVNASQLTQIGTVHLIIINHPELIDPYELKTFDMNIGLCSYLPIVYK